MNQLVENGTPIENFDTLFYLFLWKTDPYEAFHISVLLNFNQLIGLLLCRHLYVDSQRKHVQTNTTAATDKNSPDRMILTQKTPHTMNLKELKDTLANMQFEWPVFINHIVDHEGESYKIEYLKQYIFQCMSRFGELCSNSQPVEILNDVQDTVDAEPNNTTGENSAHRKLSYSAIRRVIGSFLMLMRHINLYEMSMELDHTLDLSKTNIAKITQYHHEASMDRFHKMCMHFHLPIAAKLHYKHDFPGMYNDVSQAVYFHNADYKQIARQPIESTLPIHTLPSLIELYPEITVKYEDDFFDPNECKEWYWLVVPYRIYLISPEPCLYHSQNIMVLMDIYLKHTTTTTIVHG
jgi:hypothetical protein